MVQARLERVPAQGTRVYLLVALVPWRNVSIALKLHDDLNTTFAKHLDTNSADVTFLPVLHRIKILCSRMFYAYVFVLNYNVMVHLKA